jgi:hypothetical protein
MAAAASAAPTDGTRQRVVCPAGTAEWSVDRFSATVFKATSPFSKSFPIIRSMSTNTPITLPMNGVAPAGPCRGIRQKRADRSSDDEAHRHEHDSFPYPTSA